MKMYLAYADCVWFDCSSDLQNVFAAVCEHRRNAAEYMIVLADYGPEGETPVEAHLVFRGIQADARSLKWN